MNRNMIITAVVFLVALAIALGVLKFIIYVPGVLPKLALGVVVALGYAGAAFFATRNQKA